MKNTLLSQNIKRLRKVKDLSQRDLAKLSGVSRSEIGHIEEGRIPRIDIIQKLAKALGQKPEHLVEGAIKKARKQTPLEKGFICYGSPYTPEDRKDFTKFERELAKIQKEQDAIDRRWAEALWKARVESIKRKIILAICLTAITLFIAFYFAL